MGAITAQLADRVREAGGEILTSVKVTSIDVENDAVQVTATHDGAEQVWQARTVAAGCAPAVLDQLRGRMPEPIDDLSGGAQLKVNMLLTRLPQLRDQSVEAEQAFSGTFHVNEGYRQLQEAFSAASEATFPKPLPAEIYCHSLSDPSILSQELRDAGVQTLTLFGLHTPNSVFTAPDAPSHEELIKAVEATLDSVLSEPIRSCLARDANGQPCIEINSTIDVERDLNIPSGNIFHTPLDWPWASEPSAVGTWGVETEEPRLAICGSGAARGGGVSGIPGHNAARYLASLLSRTEE
jgi:phytoene dehydrogenase-like protein